MKFFVVLFISLLSHLAGAQNLFHSPYTQHWPTIFTSEYEEIERSISIGNDEIRIITERPGGKEVRTYLINDIQVNRDNITYQCRSRDGNVPATLVMPLQKEIRHLDLYFYSPESGEEIQMRYLIDYYYE